MRFVTANGAALLAAATSVLAMELPKDEVLAARALPILQIAPGTSG